jgi:hypothetical protein
MDTKFCSYVLIMVEFGSRDKLFKSVQECYISINMFEPFCTFNETQF